MGFFHIFGMLCLLAATVLMIVVSVSTPIWKSVYFLEGSLNDARVRMGVWGVCIANTCSNKRLGYNIDYLLEAGGSSEVSTTIVRGLTYALVLNPIAAGFSFVAMLFALGSNLVLGLMGSLFAFFAFIVTVVALGIDLGVFVTARHRLNNIEDNSAMLGNAIWMVVAAVILQLLAAFTVCFTHTKERRARRSTDVSGVNHGRNGWFGRGRRTEPVYGDNTYATDPAMTQVAPAPRRHFWQRNKAAATY